jgi:hypothetical protein
MPSRELLKPARSDNRDPRAFRERREAMMEFRRSAGAILRILALSAFCAASASAFAEEFQQPKFTPEDTWVYHEKAQRGAKVNEVDVELSVVRSEGDDLLVAAKPAGSSQAPRQTMYKSDWSRFRGINGVETIVMRPLSFPLSVGKSWSVEYTEINPDAAHSKEQFTIPFKAVAWEDVETPAGKFKALKIVANGNWVADVVARTRIDTGVAGAPGAAQMSRQDVVQGPRRIEGRVYHAIWYVPAVKRWVKSIDETFSSDGQVMDHAESELTAFHVGGAQTP